MILLSLRLSSNDGVNDAMICVYSTSGRWMPSSVNTMTLTRATALRRAGSAEPPLCSADPRSRSSCKIKFDIPSSTIKR